MLQLLKNTVKKKVVVIGKPFNPNFDGNLLAWYDGDTLDTDPANTWSDRSSNGYDLTLFNAPTIINAAINGHDALQFDGINQYAQRILTPVLTQPITLYIVFKQITWQNNDRVHEANDILDTITLFQNAVTPDLRMSSGTQLILNPQLSLNTYDIITEVHNNINSVLRLNNNIAVTGNAGANNGIGFNLASVRLGVGGYSNIEVSYLIIRDVADNTATQNIFINYLKNHFAL